MGRQFHQYCMRWTQYCLIAGVTTFFRSKTSRSWHHHRKVVRPWTLKPDIITLLWVGGFSDMAWDGDMSVWKRSFDKFASKNKSVLDTCCAWGNESREQYSGAQQHIRVNWTHNQDYACMLLHIESFWAPQSHRNESTNESSHTLDVLGPAEHFQSWRSKRCTGASLSRAGMQAQPFGWYDILHTIIYGLWHGQCIIASICKAPELCFQPRVAYFACVSLQNIL